MNRLCVHKSLLNLPLTCWASCLFLLFMQIFEIDIHSSSLTRVVWNILPIFFCLLQPYGLYQSEILTKRWQLQHLSIIIIFIHDISCTYVFFSWNWFKWWHQIISYCKISEWRSVHDINKAKSSTSAVYKSIIALDLGHAF